MSENNKYFDKNSENIQKIAKDSKSYRPKTPDKRMSIQENTGQVKNSKNQNCE